MKVRLLSANTVHHTVQAMTLSNATDAATHSLLGQRLEMTSYRITPHS